MTNPTRVRQVLAVIPAKTGGRALGGRLAGVFGPAIKVAVVETADEDPSALADADVILTGLGPVSAARIAAAPVLELIQCASHGFDYVDVAAARRRGIIVCNIGSTDAEVQDVAEQTFALMLALAKQLIPGHVALAKADWALPRLERFITELHDKTLGIIGFGHIGRQVVRRAAAFDMEIVYADPLAASTDVADPLQGRRVELDELLRISDYVSVHAPLTDATHKLLDADRLALMRPTAFVVNTERGAVIDQEALADALEAHRIAGAGLDVFDPEPPTAALRLLRAPNVVLSPHAGGVTRHGGGVERQHLPGGQASGRRGQLTRPSLVRQHRSIASACAASPTTRGSRSTCLALARRRVSLPARVDGRKTGLTVTLSTVLPTDGVSVLVA